MIFNSVLQSAKPMFRLSRLPDCLYIEKIILGKQLKGIRRFRKFYLVVYVFVFFSTVLTAESNTETLP